MARTKSPKYPNFPLSQAIDRVRKVYEADRASPLPREVIAKHFGYSGLSGASDSTIATVGQYGLLDRVGKGEMKVSQLAIDILIPESEAQKQDAINQAILSPPLFREIWNHFDQRVPSDDALRTYLLRRDFHDRAIEPVMRSFEPTVAMMKKQNESEGGGLPLDDDAESSQSDDESRSVGASVGDFVQWESQGALQFEQPRRVRWVSPDGTHLAVDGSSTGIPMEQVIVEDRPEQASMPPPEAPPAAAGNEPTAPKAGQRKAVFPVSEGDVTFVFPDGMTTEGIEELEAYLNVFLKKEKREAGKG